MFHRPGGPQQLAVGIAARFIGPPPTVESLRAHVRDRLADLPSLTHRLTPGVKAPRLEPVAHIDLAQHIHDVPVRTRSTWQESIREVLRRPLPGEEEPRWDLSLLHGYSDAPEYTLLFRIHHAMQDGSGHHYVAQILFSPVQAPEASKEPVAQPKVRDYPSLQGVYGAARDIARSFASPRTWPMMHQPPTGKLCAAFSTAESKQLVELSRRLETGIGEIFLTALAGAMRELGLSQGNAPGPLAVSWPLTVRRPAERGAMGNYLTNIRVELPCDELDPLVRLGRIARQLRPAVTETRIQATRALTQWAPAPVARWVMGRVTDSRVAPITATYVPIALRRPTLLGTPMSGFTGMGCPLSRQLLHLVLVKFRSECELTVVYDEALPGGADIPRLWANCLEELNARV
ncbi:hypothetical protein GO001_22630 [Streptomyces sp. NRRL B-1677]|uniref:wax ester/triacylglycerol synthase domain-containing protein n=1 Tax=Streptomyces sp. NRRL B-1677 TaxID=2682966 RepID=UPI001892AAC1|nr:wax ester/triacylglycerol synthase domain-containing protein [Streptomyces sp. NRRL B-1677]MBF6047979.1 hypothetical protein [Streptomyces sp. NRRL B-1677]